MPARNPLVRRVARAIALLLLLGLAWLGLSGGLRQLSESRSLGEKAQTSSQFAYGLFALLAVITTVWSRRLERSALLGLGICLALAGGLASVVWGGTGWGIGLVSGVAALLVAVAIGWLLRWSGA